MPKKPICSIDGCDKPSRKNKAVCSMHEARIRRHGDPHFTKYHAQGKGVAFLTQLSKTKSLECINWPFTIGTHGYGQSYYKGKGYNASRLSLVLATGEEPPNMAAAHSCHNRACVNPNHLRWATHEENESDKIKDGTVMRGEKNGSSKLRKEDVIEIRKLSKSVALSRFPISQTQYYRIIHRQSWKHI